MSEAHGTETGEAPLLAIFSDFDGTLVELAETPDAIEIPTDLPDRLDRLAREFDYAFAVITGRQIADIDRFLSPLQLPVAGAHGSQRRRADGSVAELDESLIAAAREIAQSLEHLAQAHPALLLEAKQGAVSLHYRQSPDLETTCREAMSEAMRAHPEFTLVPWKMVFDARPKAFDKGAALRAFMQEEPFAGRTPIFIGDDRTDEDAFRAAQELGSIGIKLGPGDTLARLRIADVEAVHALLRGLGKISQQEDLQLADTLAH